MSWAFSFSFFSKGVNCSRYVLVLNLLEQKYIWQKVMLHQFFFGISFTLFPVIKGK